MFKFLIRFLVLISSILLGNSCATTKVKEIGIVKPINDIFKLKPDFKTTYYLANVNVLSHNISGILIVKRVDSNLNRFVFSSEMGLKFFDLIINDDGSGSINYIFNKMNKKIVTKTLIEDFSLILNNPPISATFNSFIKGGNNYYSFATKNKTVYYITDDSIPNKLTVELYKKGSPRVEVISENKSLENVPDSISIKHLNFTFNITLKIMRNVSNE